MRSRIDGPVVLPLIPLLREYSCSLILSTANLSLTSELLRSQVYTVAVLPLANSTDLAETSRTLGLNPAQRSYFENKLTLGQAIVRSGKWGAPILATFPPLPDEKHVSPADWHAAIERTNALAPKRFTLGPATTTVIHSTGSRQTATAPNKAIALNATGEALLQFIASEGITTVTRAYDAIGVHYQVGHRVKQNLLELGLITASTLIAKMRTPFSAHKIIT